MKRLVALALAVGMLGVAGVAVADTHQMGMEFGFNGLNTLGVSSVNAGQIGIKKAIGPDNYGILRFGFGMSRQTTEMAPVGTTTFTDMKTGTTQFGLGVGVQHNMPACNGLVPYVGGLIQFSRSSNFTEDSNAEPVQATDEIKDTTTSTSFGFVAIAGGEYFIRPCLSLSGEYTFGFSYNSSKREYEYHGACPGCMTESNKTGGFSFGPFNAVGFRLTAYWD